MNEYIPVLIMLLSTAAGMIVAATFIGPKKRFADEMAPFEYGGSPIVSPEPWFSVKFYPIANSLVIFKLNQS